MIMGNESEDPELAHGTNARQELEFVLYELIPFIHGEKASACGINLPLKRQEIGNAWENALLNGHLDEAKTLGEIMLRYEKLCNSYKDAPSAETETQTGISLNDLAAYEVGLRTANKQIRKSKSKARKSKAVNK